MEQRETALGQSDTIATSYVVTVPSLARVRMRVPLSQRELAKRSGVAAATIARAETGGEVHPSTVRRLAKALSCEARELMEDAQRAP